MGLLFAFTYGCGEKKIESSDDVTASIENDVLQGTWKLDSVTKYTFDGNGNGKMTVSTSEYKFNYTINNDEIKIDFASKSAQDSTYKFSIDKNKLILLSKDNNKGTYELEKVK